MIVILILILEQGDFIDFKSENDNTQEEEEEEEISINKPLPYTKIECFH